MTPPAAVRAPQKAPLGRFLAPYYVLNAMVPLAYAVLRQLYWTAAMDEYTEGFLTTSREQEAALVMVGMAGITFQNAGTLDSYVWVLLTSVKTGVLAALFYMDRRLFSWMLAYCAVLFVAVKYPKYTGPENITVLSLGAMHMEVKHPPPEQEGVSWLVYFHADSSDFSLQHDPLIAVLSLEYASDSLRFGKVDLDKYPKLARTHGIDVSLFSSQVPTLVLFQAGEEVARLPHVCAQGHVHKVSLTHTRIVSTFHLDELHKGRYQQRDLSRPRRYSTD